MWLLLVAACTAPPEDTADSVVVEAPFELPGPWRPELTTYPRLHPYDRAVVADRLTREPYVTLLARVRAVAARRPSDTSTATTLYAPIAYANADIARAAAFLWWLEGDEAMRARAVEVLTTFVADADTLTETDDDIHLADAMVGVATAYDLLAADLTSEEHAVIRPRLAQLAGTTYTRFAVDTPQYHFLGRSNHATKVAAGVGMIALVVNDDPDAYRWMAYAVTQLRFLSDWMTSPVGVVDEGAYYHLYSAQTHLPFYLAYGDLAPEAMPYPPTCALRDAPCDEAVPEWLGPPLSWASVRAQHTWGVKTRLPDGTRPPVDDAFSIGFYGGLVDDPLLRWDWLNAPGAPLTTDWTVDLSAETIARFDDAAPVTPPTWDPTVFLPGSGAAALRSGWGPDDTMVFVTAESGALRETGHDQEDEGSFQLFARGRYLLIDPGYVKWDERDQVAHTEDHSLVLVDGGGAPRSTLFGPGGVDGAVRNGISVEGFSYVEAETAYRGMTLSRRFALVGDDLVVVADTISAPETHAYTWLLHGWAGGTDGGTATLLDDGARWSRGGARVTAHLATDATPAFAFTPQVHGLTYGQDDTHQRLDVTATASTWHLLTVLSPRADAEPDVTVTRLDTLALRIDDPAGGTDLVVFRPEGGDTALSACGGVTLTGELVVARGDCAGTWQTFAVAGGALQ